jgi:hypothetical protein
MVNINAQSQQGRLFMLSRTLLAVAATIFAFGGAMHGLAYLSKASHDIDGSNLGVFFSREMKVLWLADSTTLLALALVFGFIAAQPRSATKPMVMVLTLIPAATTALLYFFLGSFYAAHMLLAATVMVMAGAIALPSANWRANGVH